MKRQSTKHSGGKTPAALQRINRAMSLSTLSNVLQMNFSEGACLIVLSYKSGQFIPSGKYAETDLIDWLDVARRKLDCRLKYVRATEQGRDGETATVHRIVVRCPIESAAVLADCWKYGPAQVEEIQVWQLPALAAQLVANAGTEPCKRSWSTSRGLTRS